jgi:hypothetical protein
MMIILQFGWKKLSKKLNEIGKDLKSLIHTNDVFDKDEKLLDNQDLCLMLHISLRTLQCYRSEGSLPFTFEGMNFNLIDVLIAVFYLE